MINITYDRDKNSFLIVTKDLSCIENLLPIKIQYKNIITDEIHFESFLYSNMWSALSNAELISDVLIYSCCGKMIKKYTWDVTEVGDDVEKGLWYYLQGRKLQGFFSRGLIIGTHDGRNGHWIYPVKEGLSQATLIEGSETQFKKLTENYKNFTNVKLLNEIVTTNGSDVEWFQGGEGYTDTIVPDLIHAWLDESKITKTPRRTISINEIMKKENYDWIHLDVEGIDADLILSLEQRPNVIIYESMNLKEDEILNLDRWFQENLYKTTTVNGNTIAIKNYNENR